LIAAFQSTSFLELIIERDKADLVGIRRRLTVRLKRSGLGGERCLSDSCSLRQVLKDGTASKLRSPQVGFSATTSGFFDNSMASRAT